MRESFCGRGDLSGDSGCLPRNRRRCGAQSVWNNAANIVVAWIVTLPASGARGRAVLRYAEIPFTLAIASRGCCRQIGERRSMAVARCADLALNHVRCLVALGGEADVT